MYLYGASGHAKVIIDILLLLFIINDIPKPKYKHLDKVNANIL